MNDMDAPNRNPELVKILEGMKYGRDIMIGGP